MSQALYDLPAGWEWKRLGDVADTTSGGTPSRGRSDYWNGSIPWIKSGELGDSLIVSNSEFITEEGLKNSSAKIFSKGSLLLALYGATAGKLGVLDFDAATNQAVCCITPRCDLLFRDYIKHFLFSQRERIIKDSLGGAQPNISQGYVREIIFPLPPLVEQTRIVEKLDAVLSRIDTAIDELQQSLALVDAMFKSGLDGLFSFNADVKIVKLGSLGKIIRGSSPRPKGDPKYYGGNIPRLMVADVTRDGRVVFPRIDFLTEEGAKKSRPVPKGTLTIQVSGNPGVPAILGVDACIHDGFAALVEIGAEVDINYLYFYLFYFSEKNQKQAVGAIFKNLTTDQLRQIDISLPDIDVQKKCVVSAENFAKTTTQLKTELTAKIGMFNQLKASVLDGAFRGEV